MLNGTTAMWNARLISLLYCYSKWRSIATRPQPCSAHSGVQARRPDGSYCLQVLVTWYNYQKSPLFSRDTVTVNSHDIRLGEPIFEQGINNTSVENRPDPAGQPYPANFGIHFCTKSLA